MYRSYYGAPSATGVNGQEVGAARGLLRSLMALLREPDTTHVAIAFDHVIESFRNDLFAGYKTGDGIDPDLWDQFPLAEKVAFALGVVVWPMLEFEADDALATAATRWSRARSVDRILLCSPDKDLAQCVEGDRVVLWDRMRDHIIDHEGVIDKWGVLPASIPDLLALVGDSADGIPGIARWGAKSASRVLFEYDCIEKIPTDPETWTVPVRGAAGLSVRLEAQREEAMLYKRLATLRRDVPLKEDLHALRWRGARRPEFERLAVELDDSRILERVQHWRSD